MPRLSIVIPVAGKLPCLEDTLVSVLENRPADCEIVVLLDEPYADPYDLKDEVRLLDVPAGACLAEGLNFALASSASAVVHVLRCGTEVCPNWAEAALAHFADPRVAAVAPLVLQRGAGERLLAAGVSYRAGGRMRLLGYGQPPAAAGRFATSLSAPHLAAGFYRRSALELIGSFAVDVGDEFVAIDAALALAEAGFQAVLAPEARVVSDGAYGASALGTGRDAERFFWRWAPRDGWARSLALHPVAIAAELAHGPTAAARLAGRLCGAAAFGRARHYRELKERLANPPAAAPPANKVRGPHFRYDAPHHPRQSTAASQGWD